MSILRHIVAFIPLLLVLIAAPAQKKANSPIDIFADLPIADPTANSFLSPNENPAEKIKNNIFIEASLNKKKYFIGEPALLSFYLYSALNSNSAVEKRPVLTDFTSMPMDVDEESKVKVVDGKQYRVFKILQYQLIPYKIGKLQIDPLIVSNEVTYTKNEKEESYSGVVTSKPMEITIEQLPLKDRPDFTGSVGNFTLKSYLKSTSVAAEEMNSLVIEINGTGNFIGFSPPVVHWPRDLEVFTPVDKSEIDYNAFPAKGTRIFEIPFISKQQGSFSIPAFTFEYFDLKSKKLTVLHSGDFSFIATPAKVKPQVNPIPTTVQRRTWPLISWAAVGLLLMAILAYSMIKNKSVEMKPRLEEFVKVEEEQIPEKPKVDYFLNLGQIAHIRNSSDYLVGFKNLCTGYLHDRLDSADAIEPELITRLRTMDGHSADVTAELFKQCELLMYARNVLDDDIRLSLEAKFVSIMEAVDDLTNYKNVMQYDKERNT